MKQTLCTTAAAITLALFLSACASSKEKGITSNYRTQWTSVNADVKATTSAAEAVLKEDELKDVSASATNVDGKVTAKKADGTKIHVDVRREKEAKSEVSVTVGTIGDPTLGADLAKRIKERAEGKASVTATTRP